MIIGGLMSTKTASDPIFTELDFLRISGLNNGQIPVQLKYLLSDAETLSSYSITEDVVTMNSQPILKDEGSDQRQTVTVCYPLKANPSMGMFSVLSPIGMSIIGRRVGEWISWSSPNGTTQSMMIEKIIYQPEANRDWLV
jgi:regulator of nucleoside diphosphate kinase